MTCMIDRWHDAYHGTGTRDINCPYCQEEMMALEALFTPYAAEVEYLRSAMQGDRLEDKEI